MKTMKTLSELNQIKESKQAQVNLREENFGLVKVKVSMGTCGIAAGAREVVKSLLNEARKDNLHNIQIFQTPCMGKCDAEPVVEIHYPGKDVITYVCVKPEMSERIIKETVLNGTVIEEFTK
jgi:NADP-reducing hydrogenase subunit HndB